MILLSQTDQRWRNIKMSPSNWTIGAKGCLTTDLCMLSDFYSCFADPAQVVGNQVKYTSSGEVIWPIAFSGFKLSNIERVYNPKAIDASLTATWDSVILELDYGQHFVVALRKIGGLYWVADPLGGTKHLNFRKITGSRHFVSTKS